MRGTLGDCLSEASPLGPVRRCDPGRFEGLRCLHELVQPNTISTLLLFTASVSTCCAEAFAKACDLSRCFATGCPAAASRHAGLDLLSAKALREAKSRSSGSQKDGLMLSLRGTQLRCVVALHQRQPPSGSSAVSQSSSSCARQAAHPLPNMAGAPPRR